MAMPGMMTTEFAIPSIADGLKNVDQKIMENYSIKFFKADMDDLTDIQELQGIETRAIRGDGIVLLTSDKFTFMDRYFVVVKYMELNEPT